MSDKTAAGRLPGVGRRPARRVFLSHTSDLYELPRRRSFVTAAQSAVARAGDATVDMAFFTARDAEPSDYSARMVALADVYVGIVGHRYGTPARGRPGRSYTELEFETATALGLPRLVFLLADRDRLRLPAGLLADPDPALAARQAAFRHRLLDEVGLTVAFVKNPHELETELFQSLVELSSDAVGRPVPRELPSGVYPFIGRCRELEDMDALEAAGIAVVTGTAGVGKTALAVHWARSAAGRFPDGQLYVDLRGWGPDEPIATAEALARLLRSLGVPGADIPHDLEERAARLRTLLAGRRMLMLLDNARSSGQVWPLLPGESSCFVVVTSRDSLAPLVSRHGARRIALDRLTHLDAALLLRELVGPRVDAEPEAAAELVERCARLPLAVQIAAEVAAGRPERPLADLVAELADDARRLDVLDAGDDWGPAVRAVLWGSYRQLPAAAARLFRLLGLHPGRDVDAHIAAALSGTSRDEARHLIGLLARAHLVESTGAGRVEMHELLRAYARERAAEESEVERRAALSRLFDYLVDAAAQAMDAIAPRERASHRRVGIDPRLLPAALWEPAEARSWLDAERANLVAAVGHMAANGWNRQARYLADTLWRYLDTGAYEAEAHAVQRDALAVAREELLAARANGDDRAAAGALGGLGLISWRLDHHEDALDHMGEALRLRRQAGDREGEAWTLTWLGSAALRLGRCDEAVERFREALRVRRTAGDPAAEAVALGNLGVGFSWSGCYEDAVDCLLQALSLSPTRGDGVSDAYLLGNLGVAYSRLGRYADATDAGQRALAILRDAGDPAAEAGVLGNLGIVHLRQGRLEEALYHLQQSLGMLREVAGDPLMLAEALDSIGLVHQRLGRSEAAVEHHLQALDLARRAGNRRFEATFHNSLAETLRTAGQHAEARAEQDTALALALEMGDRLEHARALDGLAHLLEASGRAGEARERWREALAIYAELGVPEAEEVRQRL